MRDMGLLFIKDEQLKNEAPNTCFFKNTKLIIFDTSVVPIPSSNSCKNQFLTLDLLCYLLFHFGNTCLPQ